MKKLTIERFLDQGKPLSHIAIVLVALISAIITSLQNRNLSFIRDILPFFILLLVQLEIFIFIARLIFKEMDANLAGREFTRIILTRFFIFIAICFVAALAIFLLFRYVIALMTGGDSSIVFKNFVDLEFKGWLRSTLGGLSFGALIFIVIQWQDALKREQRLREENLIFQNETLKSQVNPHFLFNSLNTVSSLIQSDPARAEQFINDLSSVYRYILENSRKDRVPLQSELNLLNRYFDLHRVRDEDKIRLEVEWSGTVSYQVIPVSLQILLENAIKHNIATRENPLNISVYVEDQYIVMRNNLQKKGVQIHSTGIGLKNLRERTRLVSGKDLIIEEANSYFTVKLPLMK